MGNQKILPPTYLIVCVIAVFALHFLIPIKQLISFPWRLIGVVPLLIGVGLNLVADRAFKQLGTTVKPYEKSSVLVTGGVFSISRHPMYLGMVLILLGLSVLLGSLTPFGVTTAFAVIMDTVFIRVEEEMMEETFGSTYAEYRKMVRKWL